MIMQMESVKVELVAQIGEESSKTMFTIECILKSKKLYITFILTIIFICLLHIVIEGSMKDEVQFIPMKATAYCLNGTTADGSHTRLGIAAAKPEWIGLTAAIYLNNNGECGEFLGYYEIKDCREDNINSGKDIDIWLPTEDECLQFGEKNVLVVLIKGVG